MDKIKQLEKEWSPVKTYDPFKAGDTVRIQECRPMSRLKRWEVLYDAPTSKA